LFSSLVTTAGFPTTARVLAYESIQAGSLANACGNADEAFNILCQNLFSQIQGDGNAINIIGLQTGGERTTTLTEPPTTGTLKVIKQVECPAGVTCPDPSDFEMEVTVNNVVTDTFAGSSSGTDIEIEPGSYSVDETVPTLPSGQTLATTKSAECSGTLSAGESKTCTITNTITLQPLPTTGTLTLIKKVECVAGAQCPNLPSPSDFRLAVLPLARDTISFPGSAEGTTVTLEPVELYLTAEFFPDVPDGLRFVGDTHSGE
jgi:hypothetical protein